MTDDKPISNPIEEDVVDPPEPDWEVTPEDAEEFFVTLLNVMQMMLDMGWNLEDIQSFLNCNSSAEKDTEED